MDIIINTNVKNKLNGTRDDGLGIAAEVPFKTPRLKTSLY